MVFIATNIKDDTDTPVDDPRVPQEPDKVFTHFVRDELPILGLRRLLSYIQAKTSVTDGPEAEPRFSYGGSIYTQSQVDKHIANGQTIALKTATKARQKEWIWINPQGELFAADGASPHNDPNKRLIGYFNPKGAQ